MKKKDLQDTFLRIQEIAGNEEPRISIDLSYSYMHTGSPPLTKNTDRGRDNKEDHAMYYDEEKEKFVDYPSWLRLTYDWLQEKGYISSLMDFPEFRDEWYSYIRKNKNQLV